MPIHVQKASPNSEAASELIGELSADLARRYSDMGDDGSGSFSPNDAAVPRSAFVVARLDGRPVGCGALRPMDDEAAEVKRMYVAESARRRGVARRILEELERAAAEFCYRFVRLETGLRQPEAIALYERCGFQRIPPFGKYVDNPMSVCFEKQVEPI